jgi:putative sugar O-methyltransferase
MFESFVNLGEVAALEREAMMLKQFDVWRKSFPETPLMDLDAPRIGNPWGYNFCGMVLIEPVFEYYFHADYVKKLLCEIDSPVVLEIGGGFGGLAYHLLRRGGGIKYIGLDLPENLLLQSYYLGCAFQNARVLTYSMNFSRLDRTTINNYDIILLPNFALPNIDSSLVDLIINIRSLSEMPTETIQEYFGQIDRIGRLFFFHENIFAPRGDGLWGVPSSQFPTLRNFSLIASAETRWPKYQRSSGYPCQENLLIHRRALK